MGHFKLNIAKKKYVLIEYTILSVLITAIWGVTCGVKGIWPFGSNLYDIGDMFEQCVPLYTYLWDVLHGRKNLLFDWSTGLGNNMIGTDLHFGLISPFNLFFFFVKRSAIEKSMSVYMWIKFLAIGYSMRFVLRKWFPKFSVQMCLSLTLMYVFSTFNLQYYYAPMWLELSFMFPLVIYGYFLLMNENKSNFYTVILAITLMMSFQHGYMLMLFLVLLTGLLPLLSKEKYGSHLVKILASTIIAMMLASWIWVPAFAQIMMNSARANRGFDILEIWNSVWIFNTAKLMKLLNMSIPLSIFAVYMYRNHKGKDSKFFTFVIGILCAPILLESTNILWHGGVYEGYTMRFAYMLAFWIIMAGAYAYDKVGMDEEAQAAVLLHKPGGGGIDFGCL